MLLTEVARSLALLRVAATSAAATAVPSAVTQLDARDDCDTANAVPFYRS
ncbi:hypothetical protein FOMPIDRAFT_1048359 [Fomitopsis schrenkii]|uniref:Secreted protein n=1 Tax=Fomitopsis schrenkii TaxID=2126942 RepID=S8EF10_FOMSC|nr:hypothetical protein FOMPIDRAFT_1048359 [Fomitopsis schrenkii]